MTAPSKAVLITGCSSGIGRATAARLAALGWSVHASARRPDSIADLRDHGCTTLACDVTDEDSMRAAVARVADAEGAVGVLINNAGYSQSGAVESVAIDDVRRQFETNVFGALRLAQLVLPAMRRQGWGKIVNVSSMGGKLTLPGGGIYHASKHALEAASDALRFEVRGFGVDVIVIEPGLIKTAFGAVASASIPAQPSPESGPYGAFNTAVATVSTEAYESGPLARLGGPPESVAAVIAKALAASHPRPRYAVTASARILMGARRVLPDQAFDAMLRSGMPQPNDR
ncbi:MAG: SDR family NAD(P)-dependent oxidoreductase [Actinobacteria bacterium]|jgi:NAD(P)-dependent dehydrogenase (short-subunit alcohol dehydrogenase family)|nr:SDR family NAD(P)-dependent oxidoreductase [Actinomycetota bacterium]